MTEKLYLIDGSGFIYRAFYALPPLTRPSDGRSVNAVYGFCGMLEKLIDKLEAKNIAVVFDAGKKTFRNEIYPLYKANRSLAPDALQEQFPIIREATAAYGIAAMELEGYEADDLLATYARLAIASGHEVCIVSPDKDLTQLMRQGVEIYDPLKERLLCVEDVMAKFGVGPSCVVDVQAIAGDSADNVPGIPGFGVKTAAQIINTAGGLENAIENADALFPKAKIREGLKRYEELARLSKKLVTLCDNIPMPMPEGGFPINCDREVLKDFLRKQGFLSLIERLDACAS